MERSLAIPNLADVRAFYPEHYLQFFSLAIDLLTTRWPSSSTHLCVLYKLPYISTRPGAATLRPTTTRMTESQ